MLGDTSSTTSWSPFPHWGRLGFSNAPLISTNPLVSVGEGCTRVVVGADPYRGLGKFFGISLNFCRDRRPRLSAPFVVTIPTDRLGSIGGCFIWTVEDAGPYKG